MFGYYRAKSIEKETLKRMVVERPKSVRHVQPMVYRVNVLVEEAIHVHCPVKYILPSVQEEPAETRQYTGPEKKCTTHTWQNTIGW
jgi:hypothetical protein